MSSMQTIFGMGELIAQPSGSNPTNLRFGILQDISIDETSTFKELRGTYKYPLDVADGESKITISAKVGAVDPVLWNLFYNGTITGGEIRTALSEAGTIPAVSTYTVTVTNAATFGTDLLVWDVTSLKFMTRVASAPATGQYSVNPATGVYTFAAADASHAVQITYTYTVVAGTGVGSTINVPNTRMGSGFSAFKLYLPSVRTSTGKQLVEVYNSVVCTGMKRAYKNDDFLLTDMQFTAYADAAGNVKTLSANGMAS